MSPNKFVNIEGGEYESRGKSDIPGTMDGREGRDLDFGQPLNECEIVCELEDWSAQYPPPRRIVGSYIILFFRRFEIGISKGGCGCNW